MLIMPFFVCVYANFEKRIKILLECVVCVHPSSFRTTEPLVYFLQNVTNTAFDVEIVQKFGTLKFKIIK